MAHTADASPDGFPPLQRIRLRQQRRAVRQMLHAYPPGTDALVDQMRSAPALWRFLQLQVLVPLYFAAEEGWYIPSPGGEMAAIIYLRREQKQGIRVMHIDDINVDARYRRQGLAERLLSRAEALARREQRPFLKLAVTVANTPAVTLYRRLGYGEEHHHFFTVDPASPALIPSKESSVSLHALGKGPAAAANQRYYHLESQASDPAVADLMVAYYPRGSSGEGVPTTFPHRFDVQSGNQPIGYADAYRKGSQWNLRLGMDPAYWGTDGERQAIQLLTSAVREVAAVTSHEKGEAGESFALHVPSAAHFDALARGTPSLAIQLGLAPKTYARMIMVKVLDEPTAEKV
jgi:GNAT superfamily N-acetyltransferase